MREEEDAASKDEMKVERRVEGGEGERIQFRGLEESGFNFQSNWRIHARSDWL